MAPASDRDAHSAELSSAPATLHEVATAGVHKLIAKRKRFTAAHHEAPADAQQFTGIGALPAVKRARQAPECGASAATRQDEEEAFREQERRLAQSAAAQALGTDVLDNAADEQPQDDDGAFAVPATGSEWIAEDAFGDGLEAGDDDFDWEGPEEDDALDDDAVEIHLDGADVTTTEAQDRKAARRAASAAERRTRRLAHQASSACHFARGLLLDAAADQDAVRAAMLSIAPDAVVSSLSPEASAESVARLATWMQRTFQTDVKSPASRAAPGTWEAGLLEADCVKAACDQLLACVQEGRGPESSLAALFVALLRAAGCAARLVTAIDAVPLKRAFRAAKGKAAPKAAGSKGAPASKAAKSRGQGWSGNVQLSVAAPNRAPGAKKAKSAKTKSTEGLAPHSPDSPTKDSAPEDGAANGAASGRQQGKNGGARSRAQASKGAGKSTRLRAKAQGAAGESGAASDSVAGQSPGSEAGSGRAACDGLLQAASQSAEAVPDDGRGGAGSALGKRSRADDEFEAQLAMAIMASTVSQASASAAPAGPGAAAAKQARGSAAEPAAGRKSGSGWLHWAEVFCGGACDGRWVHVDPLAGVADQADQVEGHKRTGPVVGYVVAFQHGAAKDVTRRYASSFMRSLRERDEAWWEKLLKGFRKATSCPNALPAQRSQSALPDAPSAGALRRSASAEAQAPLARNASDEARAFGGVNAASSSRGGASGGSRDLAQLREQREEAELEQRALKERHGLPKTIDGFKHHPLYVLERHVARYQCLRPGARRLGLHRGESYYDRKELSEVHSAERWRREGRIVRFEELESPAKSVQTRGSKDAPAKRSIGIDGEEPAREEGPTGPVTKLYGEWQTDPWEPPIACDGIVPKNERGNVEAPPFAKALPVGTTHVLVPRAGVICRKLGIDWAPALVGFEPGRGGMLPKIQGIVVCTEFAETIAAVAEEQERARQEAAHLKRCAQGVEAWSKIVHAIAQRVKLQRRLDDEAHKNSMTASERKQAALRAAAAAKENNESDTPMAAAPAKPKGGKGSKSRGNSAKKKKLPVAAGQSELAATENAANAVGEQPQAKRRGGRSKGTASRC